ncbi:MAG: hypothetical protein CMO38_07975 [Verrucomicrobiaceae bacterium]|nr:hypothetical protein [Verrucomicrobiaceae bacterium]|tara:strand:+ start:992 stop:1195 length:204 start_codon:yes stop_codon:yes gene_type:complete
MTTENIFRLIISAVSAIILVISFVGCEATEVGNWDGSGVDSGLSNLPQARHEAWESNARYGNLPQSR